ncbi:M48 family metalloprotease [Blastopirellula sp. JC732]|uniref:M48 family metalloprotease n=1 Tax=Blastopirellula sediminis TaxID=2894196 RepID=A0A9X1MNT4_9BACT|nr:M56 family metallopeptidase [Blastopirellula sediminis]MCC9606634.1 M48 family metalloprotease [Blastopirellula sediminis]MCC9630069.1 M48 family metalloprotease [Blastopirellula sediminis]
MFWEPLSNPIYFQLTMALVHFVWQGALIWLVWVAVMRFSTRPETRYNAGVAALAVMLACPFVTACVSPQQSPAVSEEPAVAEVAEVIDETGLLTAAAVEEVATTVEADSSLGVDLIYQFQPILLFVWLLGIVLFGGRLLVAYAATVWLRSEGSRLERSIQNIADQISRRMEFIVTPAIGVSSRIGEAMTVGVLQPMILLPTAWLTELSPDVLEAVIAHELAHVRRGDLWVNAAQRVIETLFFYHPAVWYISRQVRVEREFCCDELAILATGRRVQYAQSLELVARRQFEPAAAVLAAPFLGDRTMNLLKRVRHALGIPLGRESGRLLPVGLALLVVPVGLWVAVAMLSSPRVMAEDEAAAPREGERPRDGGEFGFGPPAHGDRDFVRPPRREGDRDFYTGAPRREGEAGMPPRREGDFGPPPRREGDFGPPPRREGEGDRPARREGDMAPRSQQEMIHLLREEMQMLRVHMERLQRRINELEGVPMREGDRPRPEGLRGGDRPRPEGMREGDRPRPEGAREGDRPRPEGARDGDRPRPEGARDGDRPRPEGAREGDRPRPEGARDGDRPRPEGAREGDRPRPEGAREGDRPRPEGARDSDRPRPEGPREGDAAPAPRLDAE